MSETRYSVKAIFPKNGLPQTKAGVCCFNPMMPTSGHFPKISRHLKFNWIAVGSFQKPSLQLHGNQFLLYNPHTKQ